MMHLLRMIFVLVLRRTRLKKECQSTTPNCGDTLDGTQYQPSAPEARTVLCPCTLTLEEWHGKRGPGFQRLAGVWSQTKWCLSSSLRGTMKTCCRLERLL
jgi:hypothetical protein